MARGLEQVKGAEASTKGLPWVQQGTPHGFAETFLRLDFTQ